ncbi:uncharacterized protein LOC115208933 [Octopus sinensis]|uniref:Uncharacterized protein LOC115208933 n=1 Tax=Octopus sinensis TaxID=2607531 RepID=A0A6P7S462_9MOLL|nr:uncharacterized protein LOC115208933 [Octopus sinensis]XP_036365764.1 uncharacterized protein LOC115208933 [Octopus sinensis]XP_036365769.1 uncharacterized protein LOC115208933 [Octopus sinensis]
MLKEKKSKKGLPITRGSFSRHSSHGDYHLNQDKIITLEIHSGFATLIYGCCDQCKTLEVIDNPCYSYKFPFMTFETSTILYKHLIERSVETREQWLFFSNV